MMIPPWEQAILEREEALAQIRGAGERFRQALVTDKHGLAFIRRGRTPLRFPRYSCGTSSTTVETTATLLAVAGFGKPNELLSYLRYCTRLRAMYEPLSKTVRIEAYSSYTPPAK